MLNFEFTYENIYEITKTLTHRKCVILTLYCAELTRSIQDQSCIDLSQQWLDNPGSTTKEQLYYSAIGATTYAAWAAAIATTEVDYTVDAAWAAYYTESHKSKILPYLDALTKDIPKTPYSDPLEIIIYLQDQLEYPILNNNRLNLWDSQYDYQITGSIEEMASTIGVRNLLNA